MDTRGRGQSGPQDRFEVVVVALFDVFWSVNLDTTRTLSEFTDRIKFQAFSSIAETCRTP
jgi:hypothetical protein